MSTYKISITSLSGTSNETIMVLKDKNSAKGAYDYGKEVGAEIFGVAQAVQVCLEEQPAA